MSSNHLFFLDYSFINIHTGIDRADSLNLNKKENAKMRVSIVLYLQLLLMIIETYSASTSGVEETILKNEVLDEKKDLELEAFYVESKLSTSFIRRIPNKFYKIYNISDGTANGMYANCIHAFLVLHRLGKLNSELHVRTLVYKHKSRYLTYLDQLDKDMQNDAKIVKIKISEALHFFCLNSTKLFFRRKGKKLAIELKEEMNKLRENGYNEDSRLFKDAMKRNMGLFYLLTLLNSDIYGKELYDNISTKRSKEEIYRDNVIDRKMILEFYKKTKTLRMPIPETRLRNSKGEISVGSKNKLGLPDYIQSKSDELQKKLDKLNKEKVVLYGAERKVDIDRKKYIEAALKRNSKLEHFEDDEENNNYKENKMVRCNCKDIEECSCSLIDLYGNTLTEPVSLKLEEKLFNMHGVIKKRKLDLVNEVNYYKSLVFDENKKRRRLYAPTFEITLPLSSLSKLQVMSLEQLSGVDYNQYEKELKRLPPIKEVPRTGKISITESVPILSDGFSNKTSRRGKKLRS
ncbi:hypothetical protein FG386_003412 [Cryptosporidium ryanae]|uniref:uncharacterized protein n=1 Tax=Cryptosporidium ryanae TaxID=515981 RepID=UPI00351AAE79|nr:hypothetical protein FG386_003412 [Cryptosporidium ryanae]